MSTYPFEDVYLTEVLGVTVAILDVAAQDSIYLIGPVGEVVRIMGLDADGDLSIRWQEMVES